MIGTGRAFGLLLMNLTECERILNLKNTFDCKFYNTIQFGRSVEIEFEWQRFIQVFLLLAIEFNIRSDRFQQNFLFDCRRNLNYCV